MRPFRLACIAAGALVLAAPRGTAAAETDVQAVGRICPEPTRPCRGFKPHDLSFVLPAGEMARDEARSNLFYAVILRSGPDCSIAEADRVAAQRLFPGRKVFSQRFECDGDVENNVSYTNVSANRAFLAVYAGANRQQASATLARVARTGRFPGANLRQMQVIYNYP
ncbi:MAG TPA: hypothetical protein VFS20_33690 [Longimicrobium sp.]|nr:hypothetical protein [Longimicrobium sp.]